MPRITDFLFSLATLLVFFVHERAYSHDALNWPQWRGPNGNGVSAAACPPREWSSTEHVRWKAEIPGRGHSTPIVWGKHVFLTTAIPVGEKLPAKMSGRPGEHDNLAVDSAYEFVVLALDRQTGTILWKRTVRKEVPIEAGHVTASLASASPVTDGNHVFAHFGSYGLYCLDFEGNVIWTKDFAKMHSKHGHGEGSSPALHGDSLVINWDHEESSFLAVFDTKTGADRWRIKRSEDTSWSSPIVIDNDSKFQVVVCGTDCVRGYDLVDGKVIWECRGMSSNVVSTPVFHDGMLYVGSSYEKRILMGIDIRGGNGDITSSSRVKWTRTRGTPYVPSMLLYDDSLYFLSHYQNMLTRVHGPSGMDSPGVIRLGGLGNIYSSPVGANGYVYVTDLQGTTAVITHSDLPRIVSLNRIEEPVSASLAIVDNEILIRGDKHLFSISAE